MIWFIIVAVICGMFALGAMLGAPYLPVLSRDTQTLLDLAELEPGQTIIDLGSGDGRLLKAAARRGYYAIGYEINPLIWLVSLIVCWSVRDKVRIYLRNFWHEPLPEAQAIYVFLIDRYMPALDRKLAAEVKRPTRLVSYIFTIPGKKPVVSNKNTQVYLYPNSEE